MLLVNNRLGSISRRSMSVYKLYFVAKPKMSKSLMSEDSFPQLANLDWQL
jgi:hypothetical protein